MMPSRSQSWLSPVPPYGGWGGAIVVAGGSAGATGGVNGFGPGAATLTSWISSSPSALDDESSPPPATRIATSTPTPITSTATMASTWLRPSPPRHGGGPGGGPAPGVGVAGGGVDGGGAEGGGPDGGGPGGFAVISVACRRPRHCPLCRAAAYGGGNIFGGSVASARQCAGALPTRA